MRYSRFVKCMALVFIVLFVSACSINSLTPSKTYSSKVFRDGPPIDVEVVDMPSGRVGWGRFTVFAIPVKQVHLNSDAPRQLEQNIYTALAAAGYNRGDDGQYKKNDTCILKVHVKSMRFNNYTWLAPIVPTWGNIQLDLRLETRSGSVLWERALTGDGKNLYFWDGYSSAAVSSVNELVKKMTRAFASEDFYTSSQRLKKFNDFVQEG